MSLLAVKTMPISATACYCSRSRSSQTLVWRSTLKDGTKTDHRSAGGRFTWGPTQPFVDVVKVAF